MQAYNDYARIHKYWAMHIPTGQVFERETDVPMTIYGLLDKLAEYNRIGGVYWKYWV